MSIFRKRADRRGVVLDINQGNIITGHVEGDVVFVGGQGVPLRDLKLPWRTAKNTIESLLSWKTRLTRLVGREGICADLSAWVQNQDSRLSVRLLHGPGGCGKTRLASEVADALRQQGWSAGHIDVEKPTAFLPGENGTLLLVDYPEEHPSIIGRLMEALGAMEEPDHPLRLLLLSRHGPEYWSGMLEASSARELVDPSIMTPPMPAEEPWTLFSLAWGCACKILQQPSEKPPLTEEQFNQWITQDVLHQRPLFILAYAVQLAYEPDNWRLKGAEIIDSIAIRECAHWRKESEAVGMDWAALERLRGLASVPGALGTDHLRQLASNPTLGLNLPNAEEIVDCVHRTGELHDYQLPGIEPDLLAVSILVKVLDEGHDKAGEWLWAVLDVSESLNTALERMGRLAYDAVHTLGHVWPADALAEAVAGQVERCELFEKALSRKVAPGLLPLAIAVGRTLLEVVTEDAEKARYLNNLSNHLFEVGRHEEALAASEQSVVIYERLAAQQPERYESDLAGILNTLSGHLSDAGRHEDVLTAIERAVAIHERLAAQIPERYEPDLALSLNNLSICLARTGRNEDALTAVERAVAIYERLAAQRPDRYEHVLARSLQSLANRLAATGRHEDALTAIERAVAIYERLVQQRPERHEPWLARCLNTQSNCLADVGLLEEAQAASQKSIAIRERLAKQQPERYEPELAGSLTNISSHQAAAGCKEEALASIQRAVAILEHLATQWPKKYEPELAGSLNNLSNRQAEADHKERRWKPLTGP